MCSVSNIECSCSACIQSAYAYAIDLQIAIELCVDNIFFLLNLLNTCKLQSTYLYFYSSRMRCVPTSSMPELSKKVNHETYDVWEMTIIHEIRTEFSRESENVFKRLYALSESDHYCSNQVQTVPQSNMKIRGKYVSQFIGRVRSCVYANFHDNI